MIYDTLALANFAQYNKNKKTTSAFPAAVPKRTRAVQKIVFS